MRDDALEIAATASPAAALNRFLESENEVLRCAAVRALPAVIENESALRTALSAFLLDPDPDVRSDAMEALSRIATADDIESIVQSLESDPVREVKLAAIEALRRLKTTDTADLLRALARSRSDDRVTWEDELGDWEDWLDIQIAAIAALGDMGATEAIDDMMAARNDEFGQNLDVQVFDALGRMGADGVHQLLTVIQTEGGTAGRRAAETLMRLAPEALEPHIDRLLASANPQLRVLALKALSPDDPRTLKCVTEDTDAAVRLAALCRIAPGRPELVVQSLFDQDPSVQAAALDRLQPPLAPELSEMLADNMLAWLDTAASVLMTAAARQLSVIAPDRAEGPLLALIRDADRPLDARIAAVSSLEAIEPAIPIDTLGAILSNPAQQVRAAVLVVLANRARSGDTDAQNMIAEAIAGTFLAAEDADRLSPADTEAHDAAMPKGEDGGRRRIRITPEGEIVDANDDREEEATQSTLDAILKDHSVEQDAAEDTPEESAPKRRKRRAVEGPDEISDALSLEAIRCSQALVAEPIQAALLERACNGNDELRRSAWKTLADSCNAVEPDAELCAAATATARDPDPVVRMAVFRIRTARQDNPQIIGDALQDDDALIRAAAVEFLPPNQAIDQLSDMVLAVRRAALKRVVLADDPDLMEAATERLVHVERSDTLCELMSASTLASAKAASMLSKGSLPPRKALVLLTAFAGDERGFR